MDVTAYAFYSQSDNGDNKTWDGLDDEPTGRVSPEDERDLARRMKYLESEAFKKKGQQSIDQARLFMARKFGVEEELRAALAKTKATVADDKVREGRIQKVINQRVQGESFLGETRMQNISVPVTTRKISFHTMFHRRPPDFIRTVLLARENTKKALTAIRAFKLRDRGIGT